MEKPHDEVLPACTQRQLEAMELLANGLTPKQAASRMGIRAKTVVRHVNRAAWRMKAKTRAQLIAVAVATGLIHVDLKEGKGNGHK